MAHIRPIRSLARELNVSERHFHRLLDELDPAALLALRQEILHDMQNEITCAAGTMENIADSLKRCNPELSRMMVALANKLSELVENTPHSPWRALHAERLRELVKLDLVNDEQYMEFSDDLDNLPPTPEELKARRAAAKAEREQALAQLVKPE